MFVKLFNPFNKLCRLHYLDFKAKALEKNKVVMCSQMENGELVLLLLENSKAWLWRP